MGGNGPAPKDPGSRRRGRRRTATQGYRQLPSDGRRGKTPTWPIGQQTEQEMEVWTSLWKLPQAVEWERLDYFRVIARYVRTLVWAEQPGADIKLLTEVRQLEGKLGLTPKAMQELRWETDEPIEDDDEVGETPTEPAKGRAYVPRKEPE